MADIAMSRIASLIAHSDNGTHQYMIKEAVCNMGAGTNAKHNRFNAGQSAHNLKDNEPGSTATLP
jgi:hypothetical protein